MKYSKIKKNTDFQKLFNKGKRGFSPSLTILYAKSDRLEMGICIGKKHGKSVKRNRIKRLLRAAFYPEAEKLSNVSVLLLPKVSEEYSYEVFKRDIKSILKREKLYK